MSSDTVMWIWGIGAAVLIAACVVAYGLGVDVLERTDGLPILFIPFWPAATVLLLLYATARLLRRYVEHRRRPIAVAAPDPYRVTADAEVERILRGDA